MAGYRPGVELKIVSPCGESWEAMEGGSQQRHCESCGRDVLNVAAMTPRQLEAVIAEGRRAGAMPCMRMVTLPDGELLTAVEVAKPRWYQRTAAAVGAMMLSAVALAQNAKPAAAGRLSGDVIDPAGAMIPGAEITMTSANGVVVKAVADKTGHFTVETAPGSYKLEFKHEGFATTAIDGVAVKADSPDVPLRVKMMVGEVLMGGPMVGDSLELPQEHPEFSSRIRSEAASRGTLNGNVVDPSGAAIAGAMVELRSEGNAVATAQTNRDGRFEVIAAPGKYVLEVSAKLFAKSDGAKVEIVRGVRELNAPVQLNLVPTMGEVVVVNKPLKVHKVKKRKGSDATHGADVSLPGSTPAQH